MPNEKGRQQAVTPDMEEDKREWDQVQMEAEEVERRARRDSQNLVSEKKQDASGSKEVVVKNQKGETIVFVDNKAIKAADQAYVKSVGGTRALEGKLHGIDKLSQFKKYHEWLISIEEYIQESQEPLGIFVGNVTTEDRIADVKIVNEQTGAEALTITDPEIIALVNAMFELGYYPFDQAQVLEYFHMVRQQKEDAKNGKTPLTERN